MSHLQVDYFLSKVKYTVSNAIFIVTYEVSYNIYIDVEAKFIQLYNVYKIYVMEWNEFSRR